MAVARELLVEAQARLAEFNPMLNADGCQRDIRAYVQPWQDTLSGITVETHVWHGAEDNWSPAVMAEYLAAAVPGCTSSKIFDGLSHYSCLYRAGPEICRKLALNFRET